MQIKVLYFAGVRDVTGLGEETLAWPEGEPTAASTVRALAAELARRYPDLTARLESVRFAVNESFVSLDGALRDGDVVAVIPPVSGG